MQESHHPLEAGAELSEAEPWQLEEEDTPPLPQLHIGAHRKDPQYQTRSQSSASASSQKRKRKGYVGTLTYQL